MNTFRGETLKFFLGFALITGIGFLYPAIWSLHVGLNTDALLISSVDVSVWIVSGFNIVGFLIAQGLKERSEEAAGWVLILTEACTVIFLLVFDYDPVYLYAFIIPVIFAIILMDERKSVIFVVALVSLSIAGAYLHLQSWDFIKGVFVPLLVLVSITILIEFSVHEILSNLIWYHERYKTVLIKEKSIRENEVKLEKVVDSLKEYKKYLLETNISLIQARNEAEQARQVKQNFVQNVSHELRTPLNLIIGFSETMINSPQSYGEVNWTPDLRGDIECIYQNSQHLKSLIDDILDMASLENKKYEIQLSDIALNPLIQEVVLFTETAYRSKGLTLETRLSPSIRLVRGDSIRIKQVIINLLSNALKYTKKGGVVVSSYIDGSMAWVSVKDTGKGIPAEEIGKVFDAFFQVDKSNNREDYGTGLGLSISKQLIELHGGEMTISSEPGKGTTCSFSIPLVFRKS